MSKESTRDAVLGAKPTGREIVDGPNGARVSMWAISARERARLVGVGINARDKDRQYQLEVVQPELIIASAHDPETGEKLFNEEDVGALLELDPAFLDQLQAAALRVSGLGKKAVEDAGKGLAPTQIGASSSDSPSTSAARSPN